MIAPHVDINFFDGTHVEDPFPAYEQIRQAGRVVWSEVCDKGER